MLRWTQFSNWINISGHNSKSTGSAGSIEQSSRLHMGSRGWCVKNNTWLTNNHPAEICANGDGAAFPPGPNGEAQYAGAEYSCAEDGRPKKGCKIGEYALFWGGSKKSSICCLFLRGIRRKRFFEADTGRNQIEDANFFSFCVDQSIRGLTWWFSGIFGGNSAP